MNFNIHVNMAVISIRQECVKVECFVSLQTRTAAVASAATAAAVTGVLVNEVNQIGKRVFIIHICSPYMLSFTSYLS